MIEFGTVFSLLENAQLTVLQGIEGLYLPRLVDGLPYGTGGITEDEPLG